MAKFTYPPNLPLSVLVQQIAAFLSQNASADGGSLTDNNGTVVMTYGTPTEIGIALGTTPQLYANIIDFTNDGGTTYSKIELQQAQNFIETITRSSAAQSLISTNGSFTTVFYTPDGTVGNRLGLYVNKNANFVELFTAGAEISISVAGAITISKPITSYNGVATAGLGVPVIYGIDNRKGITTADLTAITLYTTISATGLFRVTASILATAYTSGTATYTITWTENTATQTKAITATALNTLATVTALISPDTATVITVQLTGTFVGTLSVSGVVEQIAA